jgi:tetratricopeptide (TPR) repeat protein
MDASLEAHAARAALALKEPAEALRHARQAVELSQGGDAAAQAALAQALRATGDAAGSVAAWKRAFELEPQNAEYRSGAGGSAAKKGAKAS